MGERKFKPYARVARETKIVLAVFGLLALSSVILMLVSMVGLMLRIGSSNSGAITRLGPSLVGMALVPLLTPLLICFSFRRMARAEWVLSDAGIVTAAAFGRPFGLTYTWDSAIELDYRVVAPLVSRNAVLSGTFVSAAQPLALAPGTMSRADFEAVVAAMRTYAPADAVGPNVLVVGDLLTLSGKLLANGGPLYAALDAAVGHQRLDAAAGKLKKARAQEVEGSQIRPVLDLMLAQVQWLRGKSREAHELAAPLAAKFPHWKEACLVAGLTAAATGDAVRARQLIENATTEREDSPALPVAETVEAVEKTQQSSRALNRWMIAGAVAYVVVVAGLMMMPFYVSTGASENLTLKFIVNSLPAMLLVLQVVILLVGVVFGARKRREAAAKREARLEKRPPTSPPVMLPETVAHIDSARQQVWSAVALFVGAAVILGATQLIATLWPQLLAGTNGYLWAQRTFTGVSYVVMVIAAVLLIRGVSSGALERVPRRGSESSGQESTSLLNADIKPGWAAAALVPAVLFAGGAFALSMIDPAVVQYLDVDAAGNRYGIMGDSVVVWNSAGEIVREFGYQGPGGANIPWDLAVADDGTTYITDAEKVRVCVYDTTGRVVARYTAEDKPIDRDPRHFNLSCAVDGDDVLLLDAGLLVRVSKAGRTTVFSDRQRLFLAEDFDLVGDKVVMADTNNGRLLFWDGGRWTSSDCLSLPDGYRYPVHVAAAEDGRVFAVLSKPWDKLEMGRKVGRPLKEYRPPDVWMGRLYMWAAPGEKPIQVPVVYDGATVNVGDIAMLDDGRVLVSSLNEGWIYEVDPDDPQSINRIDTGEIGARLRGADRLFRITWAGPQVLFALAVVVPVSVGISGVLIGRRRRRTDV